MLVKVYVHSSKESTYDQGVKIGLSGEALEMFKYTAYEVELLVDVNEDTGESTIVAVNGHPVDNTTLIKDA
jgi:hypothetical protein